PELATVVTLRSAQLASRATTFVYPDPPIAEHERKLIQQVDPTICLITPIEALSHTAASAKPLRGKLIAATISDSPDLQKLGMTQSHVDRLWVAVARHVLALGAGLAYGGDPRKGGYTDMLFDLARAYADEGRPLDSELIHWFLAWPIHLTLTLAD